MEIQLEIQLEINLEIRNLVENSIGIFVETAMEFYWKSSWNFSEIPLIGNQVKIQLEIQWNIYGNSLKFQLKFKRNSIGN